MIDFTKIANDVLQNEIKSLKAVKSSFNSEFFDVVKLFANCKGRILVSGIGKSGLIGRKIAATFSSIGMPSFFIHPTEAVHGDLGCFESDDILLALSNSGNTKEVQDVVLFCKKHSISSVAITSGKNSFLAKNCDFKIFLNLKQEAISGFPVPTSSSIMTLAVCDAITACIIKNKKLTQENYVELHSGGTIGKAIRNILSKKNKKQKVVKKNATIKQYSTSIDTKLIKKTQTKKVNRLSA